MAVVEGWPLWRSGCYWRDGRCGGMAVSGGVAVVEGWLLLEGWPLWRGGCYWRGGRCGGVAVSGGVADVEGWPLAEVRL